MFFLKIFFSTRGHVSDKISVMMTKEGSIQIVNFMTSGAGVIALGCGHISHIVKIVIPFKNLLFFLMHRSDILSI